MNSCIVLLAASSVQAAAAWEAAMEASLGMNTADRIGKLRGEGALEVFSKALALEAQGKEIVHLEIGEPDFDTPRNVVEAGVTALQAGHTHYSPVPGIPELRAAIAEHMTQSRGIEVDPGHVIVTVGSKPVILFTMLALVNPGDEVVYFNPGFPLYSSLVSFVGATPVEIMLHERKGFRPDLEELAQRVGAKTKLMILNSPQNPTGGILPMEDLQSIAELAKQHDFALLSDEIYSGLQYDGEFRSIASLPGMRQRTVILDGFSKRYAMTGWRLGFGVVPEALVQPFTTLVINSYSCVAPFVQWAGFEALKGSQEELRNMREAFRGRRELIVDGLNAIPRIHCEKPPGAFYVFPNVSSFGRTSREIADFLLHEAGVATLPGTDFGSHGEGHLRLSYANSEQNIQKALDRMRTALGRL